MRPRLLLALAPFAFSAAGAAWVTTADARQPLPLLREAVAGTLAGAWDLLSTANAVSAAYAMAAATAAVIGTSFLGVGAVWFCRASWLVRMHVILSGD